MVSSATKRRRIVAFFFFSCFLLIAKDLVKACKMVKARLKDIILSGTENGHSPSPTEAQEWQLLDQRASQH